MQNRAMPTMPICSRNGWRHGGYVVQLSAKHAYYALTFSELDVKIKGMIVSVLYLKTYKTVTLALLRL